MADGSLTVAIGAEDSGVEKKLKETEESLDDLAKKTEETSKKTDNAKTKYEELTDTISKQEKELTNLKDEYTQAIVNFGKSSTEAKELKEQIGVLNTDLAKNKKSLSDANTEASKAANALEDVKGGAENASGGLDALDVAAGGLLSNGLSMLIGGLKDTVTNMLALADETREYREDMAKLDTAFSTAGHSTDTASKAYSSFYAILGESDRSVEAVNHLAELTKNEQEVAQWGTIAAGVTAKFGDSLPIEGLTEAANETAKVGQVTGPLADALNWAGISEEKFNEQLAKCNSEQERATLITNTLNKEYEAAAAEYNELTKSQQEARLATSDMEQAQARIGETLEPVTTAITRLKTQGLELLQPVLEIVAQKFQEFSQWAEENPGKMSIIASVITAVAVALGVLAVALGISTAIQAVTAAFGALNLTMLSNPIVLIVAAIAGLVAAFLVLWNNCDAFREFWINLWNNIVEIVTPIWEKIKELFSQAWQKIKEVWDKVQPYFKALWEGIKNVFSVVGEVLGNFFKSAWEAIKAVWEAVKPYFAALWEGIKAVFSVVGSVLSGYFKVAWAAIQAVWNVVVAYFQMIWNNIKLVFSVVKSVLSGNFSDAWAAIKQIWSNVKQFFSTVWTNIKSVFSKAKDEFMTIGSNIVAGIKQGIQNAWSNLKSWFSGLFGDLKSIAKKILGIESPSKEFIYIAEMIIAGLVKGIKDNEKLPIESIEETGTAMIKAMQKTAAEEIKVIEDETEALEKAYKAQTKSREKEFEAADKALKDQKNESNSELIELQRDALKEQYELEKEAAAEQYELDKETLKEKLETAKEKEKIVSKYASIYEKTLNEMIKVEENYQEDVLNTNKKLVDGIKAAWDKYDSAFDSHVNSIKSNLSLFERAEKGAYVTGKELTQNLNSQLYVLDSYNEALETLSSKNVNQAFIDELKGMGIDALPEIEAINRMTEKELENYVKLWEEKNELATKAATSELATMKEETGKEIDKLITETDTKLAQLQREYQLNLIGVMRTFGESMTETGEAGIDALGEQVHGYVKVGENLMQGLAEGMLNERGSIIDMVIDNVTAAIEAAKEAAGIHSPSTVMRDEVGKNLGLGLAEGWHNQLKTIKNSMAADLQGITAKVKATVMSENARMGQGISNPVSGIDDVLRAVGIQTAGINSLASEYRRGTSNMRPIVIQLDKRELGRAVVDVGGAEEIRLGAKLALGGAR